MNSSIKKLVIAGGGTAGWMAAAFLSAFFRKDQLSLTLVESPDIGTVGVGEAPIPPIRVFNQMAGIDEAAFMRATQGTFKLGIEFVDWWRQGERYMHAFGAPGQAIRGVSFHAYWLKARASGYPHPLSDFWMSEIAARAGRFDWPSSDLRSPKSGLNYAYHFDAGLYAGFLRQLSEARGVSRVDGTIVEARRNADGLIERLTLSDGRAIEGDFFIDCTGFRALLIGQALGVPYDDWSRWLPADRAVAVPCALPDGASPVPYTRATARSAGWQWRINLQHRTGNGYVYVSDHISDDAAADVLLNSLDGRALGDPRILRFTTGRRSARHGNCLALGLASGFLEPLESTSIHFIQHGLIKFAALFPTARHDPLSASHYNRIMAEEMEQVRDFLVLHYHANARHGEALWDRMRAMEIPASLTEKIDLFRARGLAIFPGQTLFSEPNWLAVMLGQGVVPETWDPLADTGDLDQIREGFNAVRQAIARTAQAMPAHAEVLRRFCQAAGGADA